MLEKETVGIVKTTDYIQKSFGDLKRVAVTQIAEIDHQLSLVWNIRKVRNNHCNEKKNNNFEWK